MHHRRESDGEGVKYERESSSWVSLLAELKENAARAVVCE